MVQLTYIYETVRPLNLFGRNSDNESAKLDKCEERLIWKITDTVETSTIFCCKEMVRINRFQLY